MRKLLLNAAVALVVFSLPAHALDARDYWTLDFPPAAIDWLLTHHRAGKEQLARDFYWSQFVSRYLAHIRDTGTRQVSFLGPKDTCYSMLQRGVAGGLEGMPEIEFYSVFAKIDRASRDAVLRAICLSKNKYGPHASLHQTGSTLCVNWDTGEMFTPHPVGPSTNGIAFDYELTRVSPSPPPSEQNQETTPPSKSGSSPKTLEEQQEYANKHGIAPKAKP